MNTYNKFKKKQKLRVVKEMTNHGFEVGTIVTVKKLNPLHEYMDEKLNHYMVSDSEGKEAHLLEEELEKISE